MAYTSYVTLVLVAIILLILPLQNANAWPVSPALTLPATSTIKHMLVLTLRPVIYAPSYLGLYYNRQAWVHRGFLGTLIVASYSNAPDPIGPYSELTYIPGKCNPCANAPEVYYESVARSWVDNTAAMEVSSSTSSSSTSSREQQS
jgi:hypothetical protein